MRRYITVKGGLQKEICRIFNLSKFGAWKALNFESNSPRAYKVRKYALENGGRYEEEGLTPNCQVEIGDKGIMTLTFHCGYVIVVDALNNKAQVFHNGASMMTNDRANLWELFSIIDPLLGFIKEDINPPIKNSTKR